MGFDPATMAAITSMVGSAAGGKQLGGPAPAPGVQAQPPAGLMGSGGGGFGGLSGGVPNPLEAAITPPASRLFGSPEGFAQGQNNAPTAGAEIDPTLLENLSAQDKPGFLDSLFGSLDNTFNSPSKLLGIGLLNQLKPGLGTAGLGISGLLGAFKR